MAKRNGIILQLSGFDAAHYKRTEQYARQIETLCKQAADEYAQLAGTLFQPDLNKPFSFDDYPRTKETAAKIAGSLADGMQLVIKRGTEGEWAKACDKSDAFIKQVIKTSRLTPEEAAQYEARNLEALAAFQTRKVEGMGLSERVWKYTSDIKDTIELGIDVGLGEGRSAAQLSRDLRQCLQQPDRLFRRVRDKYGNLQLSKAARLYHPGQGVYRSAAKNAQRLTRTEINMAYRKADFLRWQQLDFVVGIRIMLSNNHTVLVNGKPQPLVDMCDDLWGDYPKTFLFLGWHPQCRCTVIPILSDYDEYNKDRANRLKAIVRGEAYKSMPSRRTVTAMPEKFTRYIESIAERSKNWKSQPYYIRDNFKGGTIAGGLKAGVAATLQGATKTGGKPAVKNNSKPCTEFDAQISGLKRWAYALGLDVSKLDALRLAGDRAALKAAIDTLEAQNDERIGRWRNALEELFNIVSEAIMGDYTDVVKKYRAVLDAHKPDTSRYYADSIKALQAAKVQAAADLKAEKAKGLTGLAHRQQKAQEHAKAIESLTTYDQVKDYMTKNNLVKYFDLHTFRLQEVKDICIVTAEYVTIWKLNPFNVNSARMGSNVFAHANGGKAEFNPTFFTAKKAKDEIAKNYKFCAGEWKKQREDYIKTAKENLAKWEEAQKTATDDYSKRMCTKFIKKYKADLQKYEPELKAGFTRHNVFFVRKKAGTKH